MAIKWDVLGIGTAAVDDLVVVERFPQPDSKGEIIQTMRQGGGQTATAMVAAARQGARTAFCCRLGFDELSLYTIAELEKERVDCSPCLQDAVGSPYHSIIIVAFRERTRTILHSDGNLALPQSIITSDLISQTRLLCVDDNSCMAGIKAAHIAQSMGIPVIADIEPDPPPEVNMLLPLIDHLVIGREIAGVLSGKENEADMAMALCSSGCACCVVTAGEKGCWISEQGKPAVHIPAFHVEVVDTTGCGDVFHGVYAAAIARGESIASAVMLANASAALKATSLGGRLGIPDLNTARNFMHQKHDQV